MTQETDFAAIFEQLKAILQRFETDTVVGADLPGDYVLNTPYSTQWKKEVLFGAVKTQKRYVSFYLMPVYVHPELLAGISPELRGRMQGKSCFNFSRTDAALFSELGDLACQGFAAYHQDGLV